jgi:hypothetical protein
VDRRCKISSAIPPWPPAPQSDHDAAAPEPGPTLVDANEWVERVNAARHSIIEDSVRAGPGTVVTHLWWKDESQILDADSDGDDDAGITGALTFGRRGSLTGGRL